MFHFFLKIQCQFTPYNTFTESYSTLIDISIQISSLITSLPSHIMTFNLLTYVKNLQYFKIKLYNLVKIACANNMLHLKEYNYI